jgi:8-oxo-dGTP diphosphatase
MTSRPVVDVAVGVLIRPDGRFLLASRPAGKPYAHYWEFPGGKLEPGETVAHALGRELHEELGIDIGPAVPWLVREFEYPHAHVRLHFCRVRVWSGELHAREGQSFRFCARDDLPDGPLLPATMPVMRWLALPPVYAISNAHELGAAAFLRRLDLALERGLRFMQFREPLLDLAAAEPLFRETLRRVRAVGGLLVVSSRHPRSWSRAADGMHLTSNDLSTASCRPECSWVGASTHNESELALAAAVGVDFAVLGPVAPTASHPGSQGIGWPSLARSIAAAAVPVYAIGGLTAGDLERAQDAGAQGIALQRAAWPQG